MARELLADSGSIFVQMGDGNLNIVRDLLDEVFGRHNCVFQIAFATTTGFSSSYLSNVSDYVLWYAKDAERLKYRALYKQKVVGEEGSCKVSCVDIRTYRT